MKTSESVINPWNECGVSSFPPVWPMVGQEQVRRQLESSLSNFSPALGGSAWFALLASTWGGGKTRTAHEIISQTTGQTQGWIDRAGNPLPHVLEQDFASGLLPVMVSYKRIIRNVEAAGLKLPFTEWIPRVAFSALCALKSETSSEQREIRNHLQALKPEVYKTLKALPDLTEQTDIPGALNGFLETMQAEGLNRLLILVEEVEDPTEIRNKPGGVLGEEAYQEIKDTYLDVIPEVLKSDVERQKYPQVGFLLLCSPAVYHAVDRIPSQERRHYGIHIGRNTVADLCGYLNYLRRTDPNVPEYEEALIRAAYVATDRNMGWMNVLMYAIHRRWYMGERDVVSLLREFAEADPRGREVFTENALARIPRIDLSVHGQRLLFGQTPVPMSEFSEADRESLLTMKVTDAEGSPAFAMLHPLHAELSDIVAAAQQEPGVQLVAGGGAKVIAGDVEIDLAHVLEDLSAYAADAAGQPLAPKDKHLFVAHLTGLHGIGRTGAAGEYLYPVFAGFIGDVATHLGPSFPALRQLNKRFQREDFQSRLLEDEEAERDLLRRMAEFFPSDRLRAFRNGLLNLLEESQSPNEDLADEKVNVSGVEITRTTQLNLAQDGKAWVVVGTQGAAITAALESLCGQQQPVRPILLVLAATDLNQRDLIETFLENRPAVHERVFFFPLAELDERLLFLKASGPADDALTNLARSLLYRLRQRMQDTLSRRFSQLMEEGVVVRRLFRSNDWKSHGDDLAELWLYLAANDAHSLSDAKALFGEALVEQALDALAPNRPTAKNVPEPLVDHESQPPQPMWRPGLARMVRLIGRTPRIGKKALAMRFFGDGAKPQTIVEEMLNWLAALGIVLFEDNGESVLLLTRTQVERRADTASQWFSGDFKKAIDGLGPFTGLKQEIEATGAGFKQQLKQLQNEELLTVVSEMGASLGQGAAEAPFDSSLCETWRVLGALLAFRRRQMDTEQPERGKALASQPEVLEAHISNGTLPFRDRVDGMGEFVQKLQKDVKAFHSRISQLRANLLSEIRIMKLPEAVLERPMEALEVLTRLNKELKQSTRGITTMDTVMNSVVTKKFHQAVQRLRASEQRLDELNTACADWLADWRQIREERERLQQRMDVVRGQSLDPLPGDPVYVRNHLAKLKELLQPQISETQEILEAIEDLIQSDYAELVCQKDTGGPAFDAENRAVLLKTAQDLLALAWNGGEVSIARARTGIEDLEAAREQYAAGIMQDRGTPTDPGLGLLRFAINRLDSTATAAAQKRLEQTRTLRELIETAYAIREQWRITGPEKLGDEDLFHFFLQIIDATDLGNRSIPPDADWTRLGRLKDRNLITLSFAS